MKINTKGLFKMYGVNKTTHGFFGLYEAGNTSGVYYCRESFRAVMASPGLNYVGYYSSYPGIKINVAKFTEFWRMIERKLGLPPATIESLEEDGVELNAIVITFDKFWSINHTRRDIFTLFARAGAVFYKPGMTIEQTLSAYDLASTCLPTLTAFLDGYIHPVINEANDFVGFVNMFRYVPRDQVENIRFMKLHLPTPQTNPNEQQPSSTSAAGECKSTAAEPIPVT